MAKKRKPQHPDVKRKDMFTIPFKFLSVEKGNNNRVDYGDLQQLKESIIQQGIKIPLRVQKTFDKEEYIVTDGHRRYEACLLASLEGYDITVPVIKESATMTEKERLLVQIVCNDGKTFSMFEQGEVYAKLRNLDHSPEDIAKEVGKSRQHIYDCLLLADAPQGLKDKIIAGSVSSTLVVQQLKRKDPIEVERELTYQLADKSEGEKVTRKDLQKSPKDIKVTLQSLIDVRQELQDAFRDSGEPAPTVALDTLQNLIRYCGGGSFDDLYDSILQEYQNLAKHDTV